MFNFDNSNISLIKTKSKKNKKMNLTKNFSSFTTTLSSNKSNNHKRLLSLFIEDNPFHYKLPMEKNRLTIFSDRNLAKKKLFGSFEKFSLKNEINSEDFNDYVSDLMTKYIYSNPDADRTNKTQYDITKSKIKFYKKSKESIQKLLSKSKSNSKFNLQNLSNTNFGFDEQNNITSFRFKKKKYQDPTDSLGLVLRNKIVHDKILMNYKDREVQNYGKTINKINTLIKLSKLNKKIKITSIIPNISDNELMNKNKDYNPNNLNSAEKEKNKFNKLNNIYKYTQKVLERQIYLELNDFLKGSVYLLCNYFRPIKVFPESREEFCMNYDPISNSIYLFSGNTCNLTINQIWKFSINKLLWTNIKSNNYVTEPRSGHTGVIYKNKYIIFGGQILHKGDFAELDMFNLETNTWINASTNCLFFKLRKNHISCLIGQQMFIHGGIDENGEFLDDSYLLNLTSNFNWTKASIMPLFIPPKLAYHSCCLVISSDLLNNNKFSIYKIPNTLFTKKSNNRIKDKGLFVFGGKNKNICNDMWILVIGKKPLEWRKLITFGKPPCPRYLCSMNYFEKGNFIVVHGGKTKINEEKFALNDTYLFELFRYEWIKVDYGEKEGMVKPRCSHCSVICSNKLFIFGGINDETFNGSSFFIINLDINKAKDNLLNNKTKNSMSDKLISLKSGINSNIDEEDKKKDNYRMFNSEEKNAKLFPMIKKPNSFL